MNYIGKQYGSYTIIEKTNQFDNYGKAIYTGECCCGYKRRDTISNFKYSMKTNQCPHYHEIGTIKYPNTKMKNSRLATIFRSMLRRCYDTNDKNYQYYGNKGITVWQDWIDNPSLFEGWAIQNGYTNKLTIDRIKDDEGYTPNNCRWVDAKTNTRFKSTTNYITATVTLSGRQWASLIPDVGTNYINKMIKNKGEEETIKYIEHKLKDKRTIIC